jgi:type IV pilus assembly protein PilC
MVYTARFARNLATLYDNGIELIEAMQMCTQLVGNAEVSQKMEGAIERIRKGESISNAMGQINCFDPLLISMIFVGEESGVLGEILNQTATYFDEESSYAISKIISIINPAMLILLVGSVGTILAICMSPIFSMYSVSVEEIVRPIINSISIL